jgi:predicted acylesterase/phospholipase RssA
MLDAVRASIALPGLFAPVLRDGSVLVDGGLVNPVPVSLARGRTRRAQFSCTGQASNMNAITPDRRVGLLESNRGALGSWVGATGGLVHVHEQDFARAVRDGVFVVGGSPAAGSSHSSSGSASVESLHADCRP